MYQIPDDVQRSLDSVFLKRVRAPRHTRSLLVGGANGIGYAKIETNNGSGAGCRIVGDVLYELLHASGFSTESSNRILLDISPKFHTRGLLTLDAFRSAESRSAIWSSFSRLYVASSGSETPNQYADRVVDLLANHFESFVAINPQDLCISDVLSKPDGLLVNRESRQLIIIEVKNRGVTFGEGPAQIVQYYSQATYHPLFHDFKVSTILATSEETKSPSYVAWEDWMTLESNYDIYVRNNVWV